MSIIQRFENRLGEYWWAGVVFLLLSGDIRMIFNTLSFVILQEGG